MDKHEIRETIARRAALELKDRSVVNLGIGLPTIIPNYLPPGVEVCFQAENGILGVGPTPPPGEENPRVANAGDQPVTIEPGGVTFDSAYSFGIIRGGHVDVTVLGALQVDQRGNLANWMIPGKLVPGMGGAMDLVTGAKKVILAMEHTAKGKQKILKSCTLPLTAKGEVDIIITEKAFFSFEEGRLRLKEIHPQSSLEEIRACTEAEFDADSAGAWRK